MPRKNTLKEKGDEDKIIVKNLGTTTKQYTTSKRKGTQEIIDFMFLNKKTGKACNISKEKLISCVFGYYQDKLPKGKAMHVNTFFENRGWLATKGGKFYERNNDSVLNDPSNLIYKTDGKGGDSGEGALMEAGDVMAFQIIITDEKNVIEKYDKPTKKKR